MHTHARSLADSNAFQPADGLPASHAARAAFAVGFASLIGVPLVLLAFTAPKFLEIFRDFGVVLPRVLIGVLEAGVALTNPAWIIGGTLAAVLTGWLIQPMLRDRWWKLVAWWLLTGGAMAGAMMAYFGYVALTLQSLQSAVEHAA